MYQHVFIAILVLGFLPHIDGDHTPALSPSQTSALSSLEQAAKPSRPDSAALRHVTDPALALASSPRAPGFLAATLEYNATAAQLVLNIFFNRDVTGKSLTGLSLTIQGNEGYTWTAEGLDKYTHFTGFRGQTDTWYQIELGKRVFCLAAHFGDAASYTLEFSGTSFEYNNGTDTVPITGVGEVMWNPRYDAGSALNVVEYVAWDSLKGDLKLHLCYKSVEGEINLSTAMLRSTVSVAKGTRLMSSQIASGDAGRVISLANASVVSVAPDGDVDDDQLFSLVIHPSQDVASFIDDNLYECTGCVYLAMKDNSIPGRQYGGLKWNTNYTAIPVRTSLYIPPSVTPPAHGATPTPARPSAPVIRPSATMPIPTWSPRAGGRGELVVRVVVVGIASIIVIAVSAQAIRTYLARKRARQADGHGTRRPRGSDYVTV